MSLLAPPELSLLQSSPTATAAQEPLQKFIPLICLCFLKETKIGIPADNFLSEQAQTHRLLPGHTGKVWWCFSTLDSWKEEPFVTYQDFKWEAEPKFFIAAKFPELDFCLSTAQLSFPKYSVY